MRTKFLEIVEYLLIVNRLEEPGEKYWRNGSRKWHRLASWIGVAQRPIGIPPTQDLRRVCLDVAVTIFDVEFKTSGKRLEKSSNPSRVLPGLTNHNNASPYVMRDTANSEPATRNVPQTTTNAINCWNSGSCASMHHAPDTEFKVHSLLLLFPRAFFVYPLLFRSLQYIYESLYRMVRNP